MNADKTYSSRLLASPCRHCFPRTQVHGKRQTNIVVGRANNPKGVCSIGEQDSQGNVLYQLQFKLACRRMFTLWENMLFCEKWTRSFKLETVLELPKTANLPISTKRALMFP
jgi:hypothetical protein